MAFLRARLDEDEASARWALNDHTVTEHINGQPVRIPPTYPRSWEIGRDPGDYYDGRELALTITPARVLAEVEAKRRIIALHRNLISTRAGYWCARCLRVGIGDAEWNQDAAWPCLSVRLLAVPLSDNPDYEEAWRP